MKASHFLRWPTLLGGAVVAEAAAQYLKESANRWLCLHLIDPPVLIVDFSLLFGVLSLVVACAAPRGRYWLGFILCFSLLMFAAAAFDLADSAYDDWVVAPPVHADCDRLYARFRQLLDHANSRDLALGAFDEGFQELMADEGSFTPHGFLQERAISFSLMRIRNRMREEFDMAQWEADLHLKMALVRDWPAKVSDACLKNWDSLTPMQKHDRVMIGDQRAIEYQSLHRAQVFNVHAQRVAPEMMVDTKQYLRGTDEAGLLIYDAAKMDAEVANHRAQIAEKPELAPGTTRE